MINNLTLIVPLLTFEDDNDFYYLQIIQRKKENANITGNSHVIKNYYIKSIDYLMNRWEEIKTLCNVFNARAMIRLNKRNARNVSLKTLINIANQIDQEEYLLTYRAFDRACGQINSQKPKRWILDFDSKGFYESYKDEIIGLINSIRPLDVNNKILVELPSRNGYHLITIPFDLSKFNTKFYELFNKFYPEVIEIHKDNPTNLYIP